MFITEDKRFRITKIFDADYDLEEGEPVPRIWVI
jgi:hypothetical protein